MKDTEKKIDWVKLLAKFVRMLIQMAVAGGTGGAVATLM